MNWSGVNLILYITAFAVGAMNMCLSVLFHLRKSYEWTRYYLIFHISITTLLLIFAVRMYTSSIIMYSSPVLNGVMSLLLYLDIAFMIYFIPYFTTWVIAHPWRNPYKSVFSVLSLCFLALAAYGAYAGFHMGVRVLMILIFFGDFLFCIAVILKNIGSIRDREARMICGAFIVLSAFMLPFIIIDMIITFNHLETLPIYYFWFSLIILVYLFNHFLHIPEEKEHSLDQKKISSYRITDRECDIIRLIQQGLTSKEISSELEISTSTVNNHISNIYSKTGVSSRIDLLNLLTC